MINIILIAVSLSIDAFALAFVYGINNVRKRIAILTSIMVGLFHFFMPLIGNNIGTLLFRYTLFSPKYIMFLVFLLLSIDMLISFFSYNGKIKKLNIIGILLFSFSVSFDSLSVGLGINFLYNNILFTVSVFSVTSFSFTLIGFVLGRYLSNKVGKYSFLFGFASLFAYSLYILTK